MIASSPFSLSFKNEHIIYENVIKCTVKSSDLNSTYNPTISDNDGNIKPEFLNDFLPFTTTLGLYNQNNDLLMVAKFGTPIQMSDNTDITFIIKYDS